jgi:predicted nucleotidyltransferase
MGNTTKVIIKMIAEYFKTQPILKAWLFGSWARGEQTRDSDVDLLVKLSEDASGFASVRIRRELASLLGRNTDVVSYGCIEGRPQYWFPRNVRKDMLAI